MLNFIQATSPEQIEKVRELFLEYATSLGFSLCFRGFDQEVRTLPGNYTPPSGRLLLAFEADEAAGCVALRKLEAGIGEIKRLYVRPRFRGRHLGRQLAGSIIAEARAIGYTSIRLDTLPVMKEAIALYQSLGFSQVAPYKANGLDGALYMELRLD